VGGYALLITRDVTVNLEQNGARKQADP
jgi:hypothetical protein